MDVGETLDLHLSLGQWMDTVEEEWSIQVDFPIGNF
jgi:hypothetical protein